MNPIDDMFRDGLGGRKGEVPADMWSRVSAGKAPFTPQGEGVDQYFSDALKDRAGDVPSDMWSRIAASGVPAAASLDQVFADGLKDRTADVPAGMWDRIWKARTAAPYFTPRRIFTAVAAILLLLSLGWWFVSGNTGDPGLAPAKSEKVIVAAAEPTSADKHTGSAAGAKSVDEATPDNAFSGTAAGSGLTETPSAAPVSTEAIAPQQSSFSAETVPPATDDNTKVPGQSAATGIEASFSTGAGNERSDKATNTPQPSDFTRPVLAAVPAIETNRAIPSLIAPTAELEVKKNYRPKAPATNSFRAATRHRLQAELLFGAFYANQQFSAETEDERALRNIREVRENPGLSYQVSLRGAYKLNERLVLRSGITYSEIRNTFDYERLVNGTPTLLRSNNQIRQLEVPVLLGFQIPGRRLNVTLNAGALVNLTTSVQGRFLGIDAVEPRDLATEGEYRKNVGLGFMTSLSTNYIIGKKQPFVLIVEPFFKAYPGSYTTKEAPLKETYWSAGLQLGIRKSF
ncbi:hypothetical protein FUA23_17100 [Neolewinella aurantiaca]|uniref:Outer membrane protein beta-barrel domain-containing protein n=1 Tax=Neolewinella aurantiaca TaxID=2602767 RepID=A0A5C7FPM8_9BACT|nr:hypothetical protein [Neolewinella aurantiaca]TXF87877.1 hypothetical protein FUA23_17100 [Neolewinella aurantiaca]